MLQEWECTVLVYTFTYTVSYLPHVTLTYEDSLHIINSKGWILSFLSLNFPNGPSWQCLQLCPTLQKHMPETQNWADTVKPWKAPTCSIFWIWLCALNGLFYWRNLLKCSCCCFNLEKNEVIQTQEKCPFFLQPFYDSLLHHLTIGIVCPMGSDTFI